MRDAVPRQRFSNTHCHKWWYIHGTLYVTQTNSVPRMSDRMDEVRYSRLCLLMLNTCPGRLKPVIDISYRGVPNFETFLNNKIHDVFHFRFRNCCCGNTSNVTPLSRYQWDLLYTRVPTRRCTVYHGRRGECPCQYSANTGITSDVLDIMYCCFLFANICPGNIPQADVNTLRQVRNDLIHANSASIDEATFNTIWARVEQALLSLSRLVSPAYEVDTKAILLRFKDRVIDPVELVALKQIMADHRQYEDLREVWLWINENLVSYFHLPIWDNFILFRKIIVHNTSFCYKNVGVHMINFDTVII